MDNVLSTVVTTRRTPSTSDSVAVPNNTRLISLTNPKMARLRRPGWGINPSRRRRRRDHQVLVASSDSSGRFAIEVRITATQSVMGSSCGGWSVTITRHVAATTRASRGGATRTPSWELRSSHTRSQFHFHGRSSCHTARSRVHRTFQ